MKEKENILVDEDNGFTLWGALMHGIVLPLKKEAVPAGCLSSLLYGMKAAVAWVWSKELAKAQEKSKTDKTDVGKARTEFVLLRDKLRAELHVSMNEEAKVTSSYAVLTQLSRKRRKKGHNRLIHPAGTYWLLADANGELKLRKSGFYQFVDDISTEGYKIGDVVATHKFAETNYIVS